MSDSRAGADRALRRVAAAAEFRQPDAPRSRIRRPRGPESTVFVDRPGQPPLEVANVNWRLATPGYFETMRIPVLAGRWFARGDHFDASYPLVVSRRFAERHLGDQPLGRRLRHFADPHLWTVVGVVGDVHDDGLREGSVESIYVPVLDQDRGAPYNSATMTHVVRAGGDAAGIVAGVRAAARDLDPRVPVARVRWMSDVMAEALAPDALVLALVGTAATIAMLVGLVGLTAALSYSIVVRRREFGIRLALGATPTTLQRQVVGHALSPVAVGLVAGTAIAAVLSRGLSALLFEVAPTDAATYVFSIGVLGLAAVAVLWLTSRRLRRVMPVEVLR